MNERALEQDCFHTHLIESTVDCLATSIYHALMHLNPEAEVEIT